MLNFFILIRLQIVILFFLFYGLTVTAVDIPPGIPLTSSKIESLLGPQWQGLLLICDPYCHVISARHNSIWNPPLSGEVILEKFLSPISIQDPLYPILASQIAALQNSQNSESNTTHTLNKDVETLTPPDYATMPFGIGWSIDLGYKIEKIKITSSNTIQSELTSTGLQSGPLLRGQLMKGKGHSFFGWLWLQHQLAISIYRSSNYSLPNKNSGKNSSQDIQYQSWITTPMFKTGPQLSMMNESIKIQNDSLTQFSYSTSSVTAGWAILYKRLKFSTALAISSKIQDQQGFREAPFTRKLLKFDLEYCSNKKTAFGFSFIGCTSAQIIKDQQNSKTASNIITDKNSKIDFNKTSLQATLQIGDDLWQ